MRILFAKVFEVVAVISWGFGTSVHKQLFLPNLQHFGNDKHSVLFQEPSWGWA